MAIVSHIAFPTQTCWSTQTRSLRAIACLLMPADRQRLQRPERDTGLIFQILCYRLEFREPLRQRLEHLLSLDTGQCRAQTMMRSRSESDMLVRMASDVE